MITIYNPLHGGFSISQINNYIIDIDKTLGGTFMEGIDTAKDPYAGLYTDTVINTDTKVNENPLLALQEKAAKNLERIGFVGAQDIIEAFKDKDNKGKWTTCVEVQIGYWDPVLKESVRSRSKFVTMNAEVKLEMAGGYTILILQFDYFSHQMELNRLWAVLSDYGADGVNITESSDEIPVLSITSVPMSLGGHFGMIATDPIFWTLQPDVPSSSVCNQIRVLYQPESVLFLRDDSFQTEEIIKKVKSELASGKIAQENAIQKKLREEEFKKQREEEIVEYLETTRHTKHSFQPSDKK